LTTLRAEDEERLNQHHGDGEGSNSAQAQ